MSVDFSYPYQITADSPAVAAEVQDNLDQLLDWIKVNYRQKDDTPNLTSQLVLPGEPTIASHAVNLGYLEGTQLLPRGVVLAYGGPAAPSGYLLCDGSSYSSTGQYAALFAVIGYSYGDAGGGNFKVPDLRGRVPTGLDPTKVGFDTLGGVGGTADAPVVSHTHDGTVVVAADGTHRHSYTDEYRSVSSVIASGSNFGYNPGLTSESKNTGNDGSHSHAGSTVSVSAPAGAVPATNANYAPYSIVNYIIKT